MATTQPKVKLGDAVAYKSEKGHTKLAFVLATPTTVTPEHELPELTEGQLHLLVLSPTGSAYARYSVPFAGSVEGNSDFTNPETGKLYGVWEKV